MRFGFLSAPLTGHLNPMLALGRRLRARGHEVTVFGIPDMEPAVRAADLGFVAFGEDDHPPGSVRGRWAVLGPLHGPEALRVLMGELMPPLLASALAALPELLRHDGTEAMLVDTGFAFAAVVPMALAIPHVEVWNIMHWHPAGRLPIAFFGDRFQPAPISKLRVLSRRRSMGGLMAPLVALAAPFAEQAGLVVDWSDPAATASRLQAVSQTPAAFDFPVSKWPAHFHRAAPFVDDDGRATIAFPWERLTGQRLIYASLGTLVNRHPALYAAILEGAARLPDTQLVLSIGHALDPDLLGPVPPGAIVVPAAPQIALLRRAALCVTHAGLNTVLETLVAGVPMVALPIAFDQPGVAARVAYHGVGETVAFGEVTADRVARAMRTVLDDPAYRDRARRLGAEIAALDGPGIAAEAIERALGAVGHAPEPSPPRVVCVPGAAAPDAALQARRHWAR